MSTEKHDATLDSAEAAAAAAAEEGQAPAAAGDHPAELTEHSLAADLERLLAEKLELQDLLQRRQAEFENFKRRSDRERGDIFETATMETLKNFLQVLDDLERGLKSAPAEDGPAKEFAKGLELIYQRTLDLFTRLGVTSVKSEGEKFDPNMHHAVQKVESNEHEDETILEEYQKGYLFKGRLLRPAMVKVAVRE
ncbi:MAG: nucleotide exchange factor GrpE [Acidobacteria bacterium]|nr:nucleotide exchange factor GrpE [Acidobacteriota bacterium]